MRKKEKFINTLKNTDNREYFISSLDVGDVWISKDEIREKNGYKFNNLKRQQMAMPHSKSTFLPPTTQYFFPFLRWRWLFFIFEFFASDLAFV